MRFSPASLKAIGFPLKARSSEETGTVWIENVDGVMYFEGNPLMVAENFELMKDAAETLCDAASVRAGNAGADTAARRLPDLAATRSEIELDRIPRLHRALWYAVGRISAVYDENAFLECLVSLHDHKGQLEVVWDRGTPDQDFPDFKRAIDRAWESVNAGDGSHATMHRIAD